MSQAQQMSASSPEQPNDPPPQEAPTHDVPVYPEHDPPPEQETAIHAAGAAKDHEGAPGSDPVEPEDVDEDDLDPRKPHHPPDAGKGKIIFDENGVAS